MRTLQHGIKFTFFSERFTEITGHRSEDRLGTTRDEYVEGNYLALNSGDGACLGCGEKTVVHLFTATVEALMRPRIAKHLTRVEELIDRVAQMDATG